MLNLVSIFALPPEPECHSEDEDSCERDCDTQSNLGSFA